MWAVEREKESVVRAFVAGWLFGAVFFFGTCWWLTFAPITYARLSAVAGVFGDGVCRVWSSGYFRLCLRGFCRCCCEGFGPWAFLAAPFVWVFTEFLRYWVTGNNWNAIGYSQAFVPEWTIILKPFKFYPASIGGIYLVSLFPVLASALAVYFIRKQKILAPIIVACNTCFAGRHRSLQKLHFSLCRFAHCRRRWQHKLLPFNQTSR